jgi:hypothetical protein
MTKTQTIASDPPAAGYDEDFYAWSLNNAELLRQRQFNAIDIDNIAEELDALAKNQRRELRSRLTVLLMYLLKWRYQPDLQSRSWRITIDNQRDELQDILDDSPSLRTELDAFIQKSYPRALRKAVFETGIDATGFPEDCPWSSEQILDSDFWPD